jgi:hypothetical protein
MPSGPRQLDELDNLATATYDKVRAMPSSQDVGSARRMPDSDGEPSVM